MDFLSELRSLSTLIEVAVLWVALYAIMRFLRKTRGFGLLRGLASFLLVTFVVYQLLNAGDTTKTPVLKAILGEIAPWFFLTIVVLFQHELRQGLRLDDVRHPDPPKGWGFARGEGPS